MTRSKIGAAVAAVAAMGGSALALMLLAAAPAAAWDRSQVQTLTVLPNLKSGAPSSVEGLTVGTDGNVYVPSFGFNTTGSTTGPADLFVIAPNGKVIRQVTLSGTPTPSPHMLGLRFPCQCAPLPSFKMLPLPAEDELRRYRFLDPLNISRSTDL